MESRPQRDHLGLVNGPQMGHSLAWGTYLVGTMTRMGDVDSVSPIDGEFRGTKDVGPITTAVVIIVIWIPIHVCIAKWVAEL